MQISEATFEDSSSIVQLLKLTLGESLLPKSDEYWKWKHYQNPFGNSEILLAKENDELIGVRAFLKWRWTNGDDFIKAVRAVDTATHPGHQGKGIFTKLTMTAVNKCKEQGIDMVFNTPNKKSLHGYLKMGWAQAGKMPLSLLMGSLKPQIYSKETEEQIYNRFPPAYILQVMPDDLKADANYFQTDISKPYFFWRYVSCPVVKYGAAGQSGEAIVFFRLKKLHSRFELRICDIWKHPLTKADIIRNIITSLVKEIKPLAVTMAPVSKTKALNFHITLPAGPLTTVRALAQENMNNFIKFKNWNPAIGSMELF